MELAIPLLNNEGGALTLVRPWSPNYAVALDALPLLSELLGTDYASIVLTDHVARVIPAQEDAQVTLRITMSRGRIRVNWEASVNNTNYSSRSYSPEVLSELAD